MAETTHTGLDALAEMDLQDVCYWCSQGRRYLEDKADAIKAQMDQ